MRRFILQVIVDTIAITAAVLVLSFLHVPDPFPFGAGSIPVVQVESDRIAYFLLAGVGLTVGNVVVKPIIVAFTGRLLIWSVGLFSVVITAIIIWLVGRFTPLDLHVASPYVLWLLVGAALVLVIGSALSALLGLTRPSLAPDRSTTGVWSILDALPTPRRNAIIENLRLQQVYDTLIQFGVEISVDRTPLRTIRLWSEKHLLGEADPIAGLTTPQKIGARMPRAQNSMPPIAPCTAPTSRVPLSVARVTLANLANNARCRPSPRGMASATAASTCSPSRRKKNSTYKTSSTMAWLRSGHLR